MTAESVEVVFEVIYNATQNDNELRKLLARLEEFVRNKPMLLNMYLQAKTFGIMQIENNVWPGVCIMYEDGGHY